MGVRPAELIAPLLGALLIPHPASAHPLVDRAVEKASQADFDGAMALLEAAADSDDLDRAAVVRLLETRAVVRFALGQTDAMRADLALIALMEPRWELGPETPPGLREAFEALPPRPPLGIDVVAEPIPGGVRIRGTPTAEAGELVRNLRLSTRVPAGEWVRTTGEVVEVPAHSGTVLDYYVEAIGLGGAVLVSAGSAAVPRRARAGIGAPSPPVRARSSPARRRQSDGASGWLWVGIGTGAAAVVVGGIVLAMSLTGGSDETAELGPPSADWR